MKNLFVVIVICLGVTLHGQQDITLASIWQDFEFSPKSVPGFNFLNDGRHYTRLEDNVIKKYDITTGAFVEDIFSASTIKGQLGFDGNIDKYSFNHDESMILIESQKESIYRRSYLAEYHIYNLKTSKLSTPYEGGKIMNATFSPDASKLAYVWANNLYFYDIESEVTLPITTDGVKNEVINGVSDWVYEEEFSIVKCFWWSPDGKRIAYIKFDETDVPEFTMTLHNDNPYPTYQTFKYPKVGANNAAISVHMYDLEKEVNTTVDVGNLADMYVPRVKWTQKDEEVCIFKMNRHQNHLQLIINNTQLQESRILLEEKNKYYIDITNNLTFLKDGKSFIWTSEKDGYNHIYKYDMKGKEKCALTKGNFDVTALYGVDEEENKIYYQSAEESPLTRHVYEMNTRGKKKRKMSTSEGWNTASFSSTFDYFTLTHSTINSASTYAVYDRKGKEIRLLEDNQSFAEKLKNFNVAPFEFFSFETSEGINLNGFMIKPKNFNPAQEYPVFMTQYSGPGSQQVTDRWKGFNGMWYQMLAQQGYLVVCVDPRGTGARGEEFKKMTYLQLGKYETIDQIEAAKYIGGLPYADADNIGIFGWSYGGYMSSLCIFKGADVFAAAIAVAPVTNWKWYDSIYTERYMRTEEDNKDGYQDNSPVYFANLLEGDYLLVHGGGDDNVHLQNSMEMANALVAANKQYETYIYPNRNHGISGGYTRLHLYTRMTHFLNESLKTEVGRP